MNTYIGVILVGLNDFFIKLLVRTTKKIRNRWTGRYRNNAHYNEQYSQY